MTSLSHHHLYIVTCTLLSILACLLIVTDPTLSYPTSTYSTSLYPPVPLYNISSTHSFLYSHHSHLSLSVSPSYPPTRPSIKRRTDMIYLKAPMRPNPHSLVPASIWVAHRWPPWPNTRSRGLKLPLPYGMQSRHVGVNNYEVDPCFNINCIWMEMSICFLSVGVKVIIFTELSIIYS